MDVQVRAAGGEWSCICNKWCGVCWLQVVRGRGGGRSGSGRTGESCKGPVGLYGVTW